MADIYKSIYTMKKDIERIKNPQGSQANPARSCKDLHYAHPSLASGKRKPEICYLFHETDLSLSWCLTEKSWTDYKLR